MDNSLIPKLWSAGLTRSADPVYPPDQGRLARITVCPQAQPEAGDRV